MEKPVKVAHYIRRGRPERAVIYVRGENEAAQELKCRAYAADKGYEILYTTRHIEDINLCDVVLVSNFSRISRKRMTFTKTYKLFKVRGMRIESATGKSDVSELFSAKDIYKSLESFFEKEFDKQP